MIPWTGFDLESFVDWHKELMKQGCWFDILGITCFPFSCSLGKAWGIILTRHLIHFYSSNNIIINNNIYLEFTRHCSRWFIYIFWFVFIAILLQKGYYCPHFRRGNRSSERLATVPTATVRKWQHWDLNPDLNIYLFTYLLLAVLGPRFRARALSSCGEWGPLLIAVRGPLTVAASPVAEHRLQTRRLSSCGSRAQPLRGMRDPPRPGLEPASPASAGRPSTTAPPGKPRTQIYWTSEPKLLSIRL